MPLAGGEATLIIGPLVRTNGIYSGDYKIKVFPYFLKNEKGRLAMVVSDEALAGAAQGKVVTITGTATTSGKGGKTRPVEVIATPVDNNHGTLKLSFMAGTRQMIFTPDYHFAGKDTSTVLTSTTRTNPAAIHL